MTWLKERPALVGGEDRKFTLNQIPVVASMIVVYSGIPLELVGANPDQMQYAYSISGNQIEVSMVPAGGRVVWCRYWY